MWNFLSDRQRRSWPALLAGVIGLSLAVSTLAQAPAAVTTPKRSAAELDQLLAPIALYPDPLLAIILSASTMPFDVTLAARYVKSNGDPAGIANQSWDDSVKALAHYPNVLQWMDDNLEWTRAVGDAYLAQPSDVMDTVQELRADAMAAGHLKNTPQQQIVMDGNYIRILPAQPDSIYVPSYDPDVIYDEGPPDAGPWIDFGVACPVGVWLGYDCDWHHRGIWVGTWHPGWGFLPKDPHWGRPWQPNWNRVDLRHGNVPFSPTVPLPRPLRNAPVAPGGNPSAHLPPVIRGSGVDEHTTPTRAPEPQGDYFGGSERGSVTRDYSTRGNASREGVETSSRPAPEPSRSYQEREPAEPRGGFDGMGNGGEDRSFGGRGAASRGR